VGGVPFVSNQSLNGVLVRLAHGVGAAEPSWLVAGVLVGAGGLAVAAWASARGEELLAVVLCALTGLLVSPISWSHHWVWVLPGLVAVAGLAMRRRSRAGLGVLAGLCLVFAGAPVRLIWRVPNNDNREYAWHGLQPRGGEPLRPGGSPAAGGGCALPPPWRCRRSIGGRSGRRRADGPPGGPDEALNGGRLIVVPAYTSPRPDTVLTDRVVDLRSDTITLPTAAMRQAMATAEVGDDFLGEDPTAQALERRVNALFGAEASVFVPSGRMANLIGLQALTEPGDEVLCTRNAHIFHYEGAALAAACGAQPRPLMDRRGVLDPEEVAAAVRAPLDHLPRTRVVAIENTHNQEGGAVYPIDDLQALRKVAGEHGLSVYMDGARIFNASAASGVPVADYRALTDGMMFCFSKALGAPVGSMVVGSEEYITRARRFRKLHGGGMRQVGILAAACLVALDTMIDRLPEDHANARRLAEGIAALREGTVTPADVETNIVMVRTAPLGFTPEGFVEEMGRYGVRFFTFGPGSVRMVTNKEVSADDIEVALEQIATVVG
jgi:threonine aldolase